MGLITDGQIEIEYTS